jgi:D-alanyl-D-alanine carboxypeptidase (penicillin-binding protein 5/6)
MLPTSSFARARFAGALAVFSALLLALSAALLPSLAAAQNPPAPVLNAKAWLLLDMASGQVLASQGPGERVEPASLTKLMTAYLTFAALKSKAITLEQTVPVSPLAWKAIGSRMFIEPKKPVTVAEAMRGMIVQSGNDASIALAELIAGSEDQFAAMMNREAQRLGMKGTSFKNSTGLPDPQHYTTVEDLAKLAGAIIRDYPEFYTLYSIKEYTYNNITQPNRNRLLWLDPNVDGMKTGHTDSAGFCLIASAKRGPRRLLSVVVGTQSEAARSTESQKLLNYGFLGYDAVRMYEKGQSISSLEVWKGEARELKAGFDRELFVSVPKGQAEKLKATLNTQKPLLAPIAQGQKIGTMKVTLDGREIAEVPVVALEKVDAAGIFGRALDTMRLWFAKK